MTYSLRKLATILTDDFRWHTRIKKSKSLIAAK
jgi:hypothetical protein